MADVFENLLVRKWKVLAQNGLLFLPFREVDEDLRLQTRMNVFGQLERGRVVVHRRNHTEAGMPSSNPNALPSPILRRLSSTSHSRAAPCSAWFRGAPAGGRGALGARQSPRASMAVGGGVRPGGRSEKGRLDFLYVEVAVINELRCSKSRLREASL